MTSRSFKFYCI